MPYGSSEGAAFVLALALHAGVGFALARSSRAPVAEVPALTERAETELQILMLEPDPEPPRVVVDPHARPSDSHERSAARLVPFAIRPTSRESPDEAPEAARYALDPRATPEGTPPRRPISFDLPFSVAPAPPAEEATSARPSPDLGRALSAGSDERDRRLGLGVVGRVGGQIAAATTPAVRSAGAPDGWAVVEIHLDEAGHASSVTLSSSSTGGFDPAVSAIRDVLSKRQINLPRSYRGARVRLKIVSRHRLPGGETKRLERSNLVKPSDEPGREIPPKTGMLHLRWWRDAAPELPIWDKLELTPKGVYVAPLVDFDLSNAGAAVVSTTEVTALEVVGE